MNCGCTNPRPARVNAKCSDLCTVDVYGDAQGSDECYNHYGYVPTDMNIGGGDYVRFTYCLSCGRISGDWPCSDPSFVEEARAEEDGQ